MLLRIVTLLMAAGFLFLSGFFIAVTILDLVSRIFKL
jgi:ABC-type transport system involved in cytochrome bd biosynthesis fused ATPase/permease subunit